MSQPLRSAYISIVIAVHEAERGGEQLLRAGAEVLAARVLGLVGRERGGRGPSARGRGSSRRAWLLALMAHRKRCGA